VSKLASRRQFLAGAGGTLAVVVAGAHPRLACADELPHLTREDAVAKALDYTEDASTADSQKHPMRQPQQACVNCNFYAGKPDGFGPCPLFPGKAVAAKGWCSGWTKEV